MIGELLLYRLISQFRRALTRNDKVRRENCDFISCKLILALQTVYHSTTTFTAHLDNQGVAHELIALQILDLLLERPTDDSIEITIWFTREGFPPGNPPKANPTVFERFHVLNGGSMRHQVQYMIEVLMQARKD